MQFRGVGFNSTYVNVNGGTESGEKENLTVFEMFRSQWLKRVRFGLDRTLLKDSTEVVKFNMRFPIRNSEILLWSFHNIEFGRKIGYRSH